MAELSFADKMKWERFERNRANGKKKWCSGCDQLFTKQHELMNHRRTFRCGGLWMTPEERAAKGLPPC